MREPLVFLLSERDTRDQFVGRDDAAEREGVYLSFLNWRRRMENPTWCPFRKIIRKRRSILLKVETVFE
jgi:hypothetical protein